MRVACQPQLAERFIASEGCRALRDSIAISRLAVLTAALMAIAHVALAQAQPVHSFQQLQVKPGQLLIVKTQDGKAVRGMVVSLAGSQLEMERRRWPFRKERRVFTEQAVRRIDLQDSTVDGTLIGAGIGVVGAIVIRRTCGGWNCAYPYVLSIGLGPSLGGMIDGRINRTIYTANQGTGVTVSPLLGPNLLGLAARLRFRRELSHRRRHPLGPQCECKTSGAERRERNLDRAGVCPSRAVCDPSHQVPCDRRREIQTGDEHT